MCRVRPLNEKEKQNSSFVLKFPSDTTIALGVSAILASSLLIYLHKLKMLHAFAVSFS